MMSLYQGTLLFSAVAPVGFAVFVFLQGRRKLPNLTLALFSLNVSAWFFAQFFREIAVSKEMAIFWSRANIASAIFIPVFYLLFILAFINQLKKNKVLLGISFIIGGILLFLDFTPLLVKEVAPRFSFNFYTIPGIIYPFFIFHVVLFFGFGFSKLYRFMKTAAGAARNQALYLSAASLVAFSGGLTAFFPVFNINFPVLSHISFPLYIAITSYAIVKHKLLDINIIFREGLIYSALTVCFAGFYALAILLANHLFQGLTRFNEYTAAVIVVFTSVLVFQPLRDRVQQTVDRLFFRGSYYYQKTINDLSAENLKLYRSLLQADKLAALGTIAAGMAHEIKNPLASIKGLTQVLPENLEDAEFIRKYYEIVPRQLDRINRIVEDLLDFGHPKKLAVEEVDVAKALEETLRLVENQCRKSNIEIEKKLYSIPPILADTEKLSQAFINIILNAMQAMPKGGTLKLKAQCPSPQNVIIEISDTGKGIPEDKIHNIFDPFFTTKETGSGMGLAVTYRIIREHDGEIEVESKVGEGTTFKICLPIKPKPSA